MKDIEAVKEKLKKLFAMMEEGNGACQSEVESAMKVARKLMAEYKLSDKDVREVKTNVIKVKLDDISFTTLTNPWVLSLLNIIADNYCCHPIVYTSSGAKTKVAGLMGFEDDIEIARTVLKYAYESILSGFKTELKKAENRDMRESYYNNISFKPLTNSEKTSARNAFGNGYVKGIEEAFEEQNRREIETGFSLVMVEPEEVKKEAEGMHKSTFNTSCATKRARNFDSFAINGFMEGKEFNINRRLA